MCTKLFILNDSKDTSTDGNRLANLQVSEVLLIQDIEDYPSTPPQLALLATDLPLPSTPKNNPLIMRIQRDLNSSSASARLKALKAIKNPTKSAYTQFDVPHEEQSIISAEERQATPRPPASIQELMQNIIVYVEVRTGEDNRSVGVKKVISALGAKVNDKLLRDTTHVVFKDGLLSTYKKAKAWKIPVVSILWIEACKDQRKICDPFEFPISNIDRYENPELYEKMKRHKSMQPDSEANKRVRVKPGTPKDSTNTATPKPGACKDTPWSTNNKKTDISRFFKNLGSHKKSSTATHVDELDKSTDYADFPTESPATQFLNKINTDFYTISCPKSTANTAAELIVTEDEESQDYLLYLPDIDHVRKTLNFVAEAIVDTPPPKRTIRGTQTTRTTTTIQMAATIEATTNGIEEMSLSQTPNETKNLTNYNEKMMTLQTPNKKTTCNEEISICQTPKRKSSVKITTPSRSSARRRNSMHSCVMVNANVSQDFAGSYIKGTRIQNGISTITEENPTSNVNKPAAPTTPKSKKTVRNRRTICTAKSLQITQVTKDTTKSISNYKAEEDLKQADKKIKESKPQHRKLSNEPEPVGVKMEEDRVDDLIKIKTNSNIIPNKRRTLFTPQELVKSYSHTHLETKVASATKCEPSVTKSLPSAAKCLPKDNQCSTIYGGDMQTTSNMADFKQFSTPTPVACSTLLPQNNDDLGKLTATPPQLIGSLLEEHANATVFSSSRNPGRRRTLFDVSMDIITQRLQNINQSSAARRSMARPSNYDLEVRRNSLEEETPQLLSPVFSSMPNLPIANTCKLKLFSTPTATAKAADNEVMTNTKPKVSEDQNAKNAAAVRANVETAQNPVIKKKRKLFVLNESPLLQTSIAEPPMPSASKNIVNTTPRSSIKRRRTLMPLAQPQSDIKSISSTISPSKSSTLIASNGKQVENSAYVATPKNTRAPRRSTLDFETATKLKVCTATGAKQIVVAGNKAPTSSQNIMDVAKNNNNKSEKAAAVQAAANKSKYWPNTPAACLVYTNMHKEQIEVIKQTVAKLGFFTLEDNVSDATTHVVSMEPRRTLNLLRALSRGLWILEFPWIEDSLRAGIWLSEEQYEMKDFSRAVEICRAERQAFGKDYRSELFTGLGLFYLPTRCGPLQKEDLTELILLCGGKITDQRKRAKYILGDANRIMDDKSYITPFWILDSITQMQLQKLSKYVPLVTDNACAVVTSTSVPSSSQQQQSSQSNPPRAHCVVHDAK